MTAVNKLHPGAGGVLHAEIGSTAKIGRAGLREKSLSIAEIPPSDSGRGSEEALMGPVRLEPIP